MSLDLWFYVVAVISVLATLVIERLWLNKRLFLNYRDGAFFLLNLVSSLLSFGLSFYALKWFVGLFGGFEIISVSNINIPRMLNIGLAVLLVDLFHYVSHRIYHKFSFLWRLHRLHHCDNLVDAFTTFLHHPLEIVSNYFIMVTCYVLFDIPIPVLIGYSFLTAIHSPITHSRLLLPDGINRYISYLIITPNFHRIHHSISIEESNFNYGHIFPFWDRLLGTYHCKNNISIGQMALGVEFQPNLKNVSLVEMMINPFR